MDFLFNPVVEVNITAVHVVTASVTVTESVTDLEYANEMAFLAETTGLTLPYAGHSPLAARSWASLTAAIEPRLLLFGQLRAQMCKVQHPSI